MFENFSEQATTISPYKDESEFLQELGDVLHEDYGTNLEGDDLEQAGENITAFLCSFLLINSQTENATAHSSLSSEIH